MKNVPLKFKDFISRLLRKKSDNRMSAAECLEHSWLAEKEMPNKTSTIRIENLRIFLARRKLKNVNFLWDMNNTKWCNGFYIEFRQSFAKETFSYDEYLKS